MTPSTPLSGGASRPASGDRPSGESPPRPGADVPLVRRGDDAWSWLVELVTATLVWGGIGWLADRWLGTAPWLMCAGFVVGNGAGIYLLYLRSQPAPPDAVEGSPHGDAR